MQAEIIMLGILILSLWIWMVYQYLQQHKHKNNEAEIDVIINSAIHDLTVEVNAIKKQVMDLTQEVRVDPNDPSIWLDKDGLLDAQRYLDTIIEAQAAAMPKGEPADTDEFAEVDR